MSAGDRPTRRQRRFTRALTFLGLGIAALLPLGALVVAAEADSPAVGAVGIVLLAVLLALVGRR